MPLRSFDCTISTYRRTNHENIHVRGYQEAGIITTPFDMTVLSDKWRGQPVKSVDTKKKELSGTFNTTLQLR